MDLVHISPGVDDNVVFQLAIGGIITDLNIRVEILIGHSLEYTAIACPFGGVIADEIIVVPGEGFVRDDGRVVVGAHEGHAVGVGMEQEARVGAAGVRAWVTAGKYAAC